MQTQPFQTLPCVAPPERPGLNGIACDVVARVVAARGGAVQDGSDSLCEITITALVAAAITGVRARCLAVLADARRAGITDIRFIDAYMPAAARRMGADWTADRMGFAQVSIGMAQLQSLLRDIPAGCGKTTVPCDSAPAQGAAIMVVPAGEQHSFGARIAANRLRRGGVAVDLMIAPSPARLLGALRGRGIDALMFSAGGAGGLAICRDLIHVVRCDYSDALPTIVGGASLERGQDVAASTGADIVTSDPGAALRACMARIPIARVSA